ncbi:MAG: P-loop NTPase [Acidobacteriota bacterium]|nr:P-loop NTPase [Acidobacteriota bacterium]
MSKQPIIIPVASGKGGVGKSWFTANLGLALAQSGKSTIVIDLDLGGSNLHTFLGLPNKYAGVGDYLKVKGMAFDQLAVPTPFPNLRFIPGDGQSLFMGNIAYAQKIKLLRALKKLEADFVIIDLGAGSSYNNLDFFAVAPNGIVITTPEFPAMLNLMTFLKNLVFRAIENVVRKCFPLHQKVKEMFVQSIEDNPITVGELLQLMDKDYPKYAVVTRRVVSCIRPRLVINMGVGLEDLNYLMKINKQLTARLSVDFDHFGFIPRDPQVFDSIQKHQVYLQTHPDALPAVAIEGMADRTVRLWRGPIDKSWERLYANTQRILAGRN